MYFIIVDTIVCNMQSILICPEFVRPSLSGGAPLTEEPGRRGQRRESRGGRGGGPAGLGSLQGRAAGAGMAAGAAGAGRLKVALLQLGVSADKARNLAAARGALEAAARQGARLAVLPEMWNCPYSNDSFGPYAEELEAAGGDPGGRPSPGASPSLELLQQAARELGLAVVGGSVPERDAGGRLFNACPLIQASSGHLLGVYRKTHLFDIDIPGKITFRESDTLTQGPGGLVLPEGEMGPGMPGLGVGICYDLRFPELAQSYARRGARLLVFPGAFNTTTGPEHWRLLLRARAVDNQCFVAACSPARDPSGEGYQAWGHSMVVGPFGEVLCEAAETPSTIIAELDLAQVDERRRNMPLEQQRRRDLYEVLDRMGGADGRAP